MFIIPHAGFFYGPFSTANDAAAFVADVKLAGPWSIVKLHNPLSDDEKADIIARFKKQHGE